MKKPKPKQPDATRVLAEKIAADLMTPGASYGQRVDRIVLRGCDQSHPDYPCLLYRLVLVNGRENDEVCNLDYAGLTDRIEKHLRGEL